MLFCYFNISDHSKYNIKETNLETQIQANKLILVSNQLITMKIYRPTVHSAQNTNLRISTRQYSVDHRINTHLQLNIIV